MTEKELQDLIGLKKYEQPDEGYFDDFLVEFQQRQRSEMLQTSARGLLIERLKTWFGEFKASRSLRWVASGGLAYAVVALLMSMSANDDEGDTAIMADIPAEGVVDTVEDVAQDEQEDFSLTVVSMEFAQPVDFSSPRPVFSSEKRFF